MKRNKDIFNLEQTKDLPKDLASYAKVSVKKNGHLKAVDERTRPIIELFKVKKALNNVEIMIGLYRLFKIRRDKKSISMSLSFLAKTNRIKRLSRGLYARI
jgi:hypothetical protein